MKSAYVRNNVIERLYPEDEAYQPGEWMECKDDAKIGEVFNMSLLSRDEKVALAKPSQQDMLSALWDFVVNSDPAKLDIVKKAMAQAEADNPA